MSDPIAVRDDVDIVTAMVEGDSSAFGSLYDRHSRAVFAYAASIVLSSEDAEEVMQDAFVTAWEKLKPELIVGRSALPWLLVTARNKSLNKRRSNERRAVKHTEAPFDDTIPSTLPSLEEQLISDQLMAEVDAAVATLSELDQSVYRLCLVGSTSYAEAAEVLGVSDGSVRNRLSRLRSKLRHEISILRGVS